MRKVISHTAYHNVKFVKTTAMLIPQLDVAGPAHHHSSMLGHGRILGTVVLNTPI